MMLDLIKAFDDEHGLNEHGYLFAVQFIKTILGERAVVTFAKAIKIQDDRYFIKEEGTAYTLWKELLGDS